MTADRRLLLVHAHPDDESSQSSATMARYVSEGAQVTLVTCTGGERGEILVPEWQHLTPAQLGAKRREEIAKALEILGVTDHVWLGGIGRYEDTGMASDEVGRAIPPSELPENSFWRADLLEAALYLVEVIRNRQPQIISSYDPNGNYGHPDHIQAHRVMMYAAQLAGVTGYRTDLGEPWQVSRVLWSCNDWKTWAKAGQIAREQGLDIFGGRDLTEVQDERMIQPHIDAIIPVEPWVTKREQALGAHRSQVDPNSDFWQFYRIMQQLPGAGEAYQLVSGVPYPEAEEPSADLFLGL